MSDILPRDGAPQEPELVSLLPDDARLSVAAVSYYVSSELRTLEANWDVEGWNALIANPESANEEIDRISKFVEHGKGLATKLTDHSERPDEPMSLTDDDLVLFGFALFRFGNAGYAHAVNALDKITVADPGHARALLDARRQQTARIFSGLQPTAENRGIEWMVWSSDIATRLGHIAVQAPGE